MHIRSQEDFKAIAAIWSSYFSGDWGQFGASPQDCQYSLLIINTSVDKPQTGKKTRQFLGIYPADPYTTLSETQAISNDLESWKWRDRTLVPSKTDMSYERAETDRRWVCRPILVHLHYDYRLISPYEEDSEQCVEDMKGILSLQFTSALSHLAKVS